MRDPGVQDMGVREELGMGVLGEEESGAPGTELLGGTWVRGSWEPREWGRREDLVAEEQEHRARGYREHWDLGLSGHDGRGGSGIGEAGNTPVIRMPGGPRHGKSRRTGNGDIRSTRHRGS